MIEVLKTVEEAKARLRSLRQRGRTIGLVPTMGALHPGHLSLVERASRENEIVVVSIFINPTQFNDPGDLDRYPRDFEADKRRLDDAGVHYIFSPGYREMYRDDYRYKVTENDFSKELEGAHRPGYFDGVLTVVLKLLSIIAADRAYFGEKDWQQYLLIRDMAQAFFLDTKIVPCELVRESDGLAMSSRNSLLTSDQRRIAPLLHEVISSDETLKEKHRRLTDAGFVVDYIEQRDDRVLAAASLGKVRLIDNVRI